MVEKGLAMAIIFQTIRTHKLEMAETISPQETVMPWKQNP